VAQRTTPGTDIALTIAASDSCGGAGIQADLKTLTAMRVYGATAITAVTAQNTQGVMHMQLLAPELVEQQIDAVAGDLNISATRTGLLGSSEIIEIVAKAIKRHTLAPLVVDPVMISKNGDALIDDDAVESLAKHILPLCAIVTPNRHEASRLLGRPQPIADITIAKSAAKEICERFGARSCVIKAFRRPNDQEGDAVDIFYDGEQANEIVSEWRPTENTHGSGCVFAAAITGALALGQPLDQAVQTAKTVVSEAVRQCTDIGQGKSPVNAVAILDVK